MRRMLVLGAILSSGALAVTPVPPDRGIYTNEEEVYFAAERGESPVPWIGIQVTDPSTVGKRIDAFGDDIPNPEGIIGLWRSYEELRGQLIAGITARNAAGKTFFLRRARSATCWTAVPKAQKKPDGSEDWHFERGLKLHDQGGRVSAGGGATGAKPLVLRMRNVIWPSGPNRPSLVLYVHAANSPDRAEAYGWADPGAKTIGINLRWMQASCTIDTSQGETLK